MQEVHLRTGVWYDDRPLTLTFPDAWDVVTFWPDTPPPLSDEEILTRINSPIGPRPLRELAKGITRPVIIVDDLARPTPVFRILPFLLKEFLDAGIAPENVRILVATGTHGGRHEQALANKIGKEAFTRCQIIIHNDKRRTQYVGTTSFGTPVYVNRELTKSDLILGVGGVYPQHATGFGGGAKLVLGVLGRRSITRLHFTHEGVGGTYNIENNFRQDLTEIARMVSLNTIFTLHINSRKEVVNLLCGDHFTYYPQAAEFSKARYTAPLPENADAVIANTYPSDISYTFMQKGMKPVECAPKGATRIVIASNSQGLGHHGLFPQGKSRRYRKYKYLFHRISIMEPRVIIYKIFKNLFLRKTSPRQPRQKSNAQSTKNETLWLYRPEGPTTPLPPISGVETIRQWDNVLALIKREHSSKETIRVRVYPCSSLQCLDTPAAHDGDAGD